MERAALDTIGEIGGSLANNDGVMSGLVATLGGGDVDVEYALKAIREIGAPLAHSEAVVSGVVGFLQGSEDTAVRGAVLKAIREIGAPLAHSEAFVSVLVAALRDSEQVHVRKAALSVIGAIGEPLANNDGVVSGVVACLQDSEDYKVRYAALKAIRRVGASLARSEVFVLGVVALLRDSEDGDVRVATLKAIRKIGEPLARSDAFVSGVVALLHDSKARVRVAALEAIGKISKPLASSVVFMNTLKAWLIVLADSVPAVNAVTASAGPSASLEEPFETMAKMLVQLPALKICVTKDRRLRLIDGNNIPLAPFSEAMSIRLYDALMAVNPYPVIPSLLETSRKDVPASQPLSPLPKVAHTQEEPLAPLPLAESPRDSTWQLALLVKAHSVPKGWALIVEREEATERTRPVYGIDCTAIPCRGGKRIDESRSRGQPLLGWLERRFTLEAGERYRLFQKAPVPEPAVQKLRATWCASSHVPGDGKGREVPSPLRGGFFEEPKKEVVTEEAGLKVFTGDLYHDYGLLKQLLLDLGVLNEDDWPTQSTDFLDAAGTYCSKQQVSQEAKDNIRKEKNSPCCIM